MLSGAGGEGPGEVSFHGDRYAPHFDDTAAGKLPNGTLVVKSSVKICFQSARSPTGMLSPDGDAVDVAEAGFAAEAEMATAAVRAHTASRRKTPAPRRVIRELFITPTCRPLTARCSLP